MALPELPFYVPNDEDHVQEYGTPDPVIPVYSTHRGKIPQGHEQRQPFIPAADGPLRYREAD